MTPNFTGRSASVTTNSLNNNYSATFTNQDIPNNDTVIITGQKSGTGLGAPSPIPAGTFTFAVFDATSRAMVATATNAADGSITFTPIEYTEMDVGRHLYFVQETGTSNSSWTIDKTVIRVMVTVSLSGNDVVAAVDYHYGPVVFTNNYNARGYFQPVAIKDALTGSLTAGQFNFTVTDATNTVVSTGTNDADGNIIFTPITYDGTSLGPRTYTISEVGHGGNGWSVISGTYTVNVDVEEDPLDPTGDLVITSDTPAGGFVFRNEYIADGFLTLFAQKRASGNVLSNQQFHFEVQDENGNDIADGTNDVNGNIMFNTIEYHSYNAADIGFHNYTIVETSTSGGGWTTSTISYPIMVFVADNGDGTMTVTPFNFSGAGTIFTNVYGSSGSVTLNATKTARGGALTAGQFEFAVQDEFGLTVATGVNDAAGNITFSPINYTNNDVGTHNYTVFETSAGGNGWTPSSVVYNVSVQVVDNGNGTITATPTYPDSGVVFVNTYGASGSIALSAVKSVTGSSLAAAAGAFNFAVMDGNGVVVSTGTNDANGNILFSAIPYTLADVGVTHNYTIVERDIGSINWQTDGTVVNVSVNVVDNGDGTITATQTSPDPLTDIVFTNTFIPPPSGTLVISKTFSGLPAGYNVFDPNNLSTLSFLVVGNDNTNTEIYRLTIPFNRANFSFNPGTGNFDCVLPGLPLGTYTVTESGGHAPGYDLSISTPLPSASLTATGASFNITNNYTPSPVTPPAQPAITVNKVFHGLTAAERPANFQLVVTGPGGFNQTLNLNQAISGTGGTFTNLAPGTYTINESNSSVSGFNKSVNINNDTVTLPYTFRIADTTTGHLTFIIDNYYTPVPPPSDNLTISKAFIGLPGGFNVLGQNNMSPVSFLVVGYNSANTEIYRRTIPFNSTNFTWNSGTRTFDCQLRNLPLATYSVYESGGHIPGYELSVSTLPPVVPGTTTSAAFNISNSYRPSQVTPADHPALTVNKVFHGLTTAERPGDFQIVITGPGGFNQSLDLNEAVSGGGGTFTNLTAGTYTIRESNSNVPGFNIAVSINNSPVTLPHTVQVNSGHITVTIDNYYTTPSPAPLTGINSNIVIPVILLSIGAACIVGAVIYRKRTNKKKKNEDE